MSIFKHSAGEGQQAATAPSNEPAVEAGQADQPSKLMPPFVAPAAPPRAAATPGVVPPPAAPMYSMRPPEAAARPEADAERPAAESPKAAGDPQPAPSSAQERIQAAAQLVRTPAASAPASRRPVRQTAPRPLLSQPHYEFNPVAAAQAGLLNLAWSWQEAGAPIRAIHTYMELLARHPGTPAAAAAVADLVALSNKLAQQGNFHIALSIYEEMEHLHQMQEEE